MGQKRSNHVTLTPRRVYVWLARTATDTSFWDIAVAMGKDRECGSGLMDAYDRALEQINLNHAFKRLCMDAMRRLFAHADIPKRARKWIDATLEPSPQEAA